MNITTNNMEINLIIYNKNKRTAPSSPTVSRNTEEDIEIYNEQNTIATKIHKELIIKKAKIIRPSSQATIELNAILGPVNKYSLLILAILKSDLHHSKL